MNNSQICRSCKEDLCILQFGKGKVSCKTCIKLYYDEWKRKHPEYHQQWREKNKERNEKIIAVYGNEPPEHIEEGA